MLTLSVKTLVEKLAALGYPEKGNNNLLHQIFCKLRCRKDAYRAKLKSYHNFNH